MAAREVVYKEQAKRFREVIREQFGTQIALAKAIGAKDGSYLTPYVNGRSMIGKILRKKLEIVGIDVDYVIGGRRKEGDPGSCAEQNREIYDLCTDKILDIQKKLMELSTDVLEINKMISTIKKCVD
ncbi:MAG: helix-turn-helix transcriptional regulator [Chlorobiaceae bacterium]|jgi:hypothetical protein|nr:helix-turn-helix transcriptional regulator [Chlorobiales bacterium]NMW18299.1 helix-turn-helix transcriptional regulator [Chlorobiaceae bacterium]